jgi:hypothetical protein
MVLEITGHPALLRQAMMVPQDGIAGRISQIVPARVLQTISEAGIKTAGPKGRPFF